MFSATRAFFKIIDTVQIDQYFNNVVALLKGDDTTGSVSFVDKSKFRSYWANTGSVDISATRSMFGGSSIRFFGGANSIYAYTNKNQFTFGTNDFTIEFFCYPTSLSNAAVLFDFRVPVVNGAYPLLSVSTNGSLSYYVNSATQISTAAGVITTNTWKHVALSRSAGVTRLFVDGVQVGSSWTDSTNYLGNDNRPRFGANGVADLDFFTGYLDEIRITKGVGRYAANFSPPGQEFALTSGSLIVNELSSLVQTINHTQANYYLAVNPAGTKLYLCKAENSALGILDVTNNSSTSIAVGSQPTSAVVSPDGTKVYVTNQSSSSVSVVNATNNTVSATITVGTSPGRCALNPSGTRLYVTNQNSNSVSVIDTSNNTVISTITVGSTPMGISVSPDGTKGYVNNSQSGSLSVLNLTNNTVQTTISSISSISQGSAISPNGSWVYVARTNGYVAVINTSTNTVSTNINVGGYPYGLVVNAAGNRLYVSDNNNNKVIVVKIPENTIHSEIYGISNYPNGIAIAKDDPRRVYVANYSSSVSVISSVEHYAALLTKANAGNTFSDVAQYRTITPTGATTSTSVTKFAGKTSISLNGSSYLSVSNSDCAFGTGDFTVEAWVYLTSGSNSNVIASTYGASSADSWWFRSNFGMFQYGSGDTTALNGGTIWDNAWTHVAVSRTGNYSRLFVNGVQTAAATDNNNSTRTNLVIGGLTTSQQFFNGYIQDLRVTKGIGIYSGPFTPPDSLV